jgi:hypothetical protein
MQLSLNLVVFLNDTLMNFRFIKDLNCSFVVYFTVHLPSIILQNFKPIKRMVDTGVGSEKKQYLCICRAIN